VNSEMKIRIEDRRGGGEAASKNHAPERCDVAVIGAGPYGLSAGVHLKAKGLRVRVFGEPMEFWAKKMPQGMLLRSPRVASNLSDPDHAFTLDAYETATRLEPCAPLPLDTFVEYGKWFRHQLGSALDPTTVAQVESADRGFRVWLEDGSNFLCSRVVVAAGIGPFRKKPEVFQNFPQNLVSHCYEGRDVKQFAGKRVVVIGSGQSALESAAILSEAGAQVEIIARDSKLKWIGSHKWLHQMGPLTRMLYSSHDVGPIGISRLVAYPNLVRLVPLKLRDKIRTRAVRPAGSQWLPARLVNVKLNTSRAVSRAIEANGGLALTLDDGSERQVDHVLLGTGYRVDISRYEFLSPELVRQVETFDGYPKLRSGFRSSVPGLHFIGATAARTFGPLLYFVAGTEFASRELVSYVARHTKAAQ
jgi:cation diffusion facilitator CzcD-associated flavoprotein CzcO